jgi:hypothetical protein
LLTYNTLDYISEYVGYKAREPCKVTILDSADTPSLRNFGPTLAVRKHPAIYRSF